MTQETPPDLTILKASGEDLEWPLGALLHRRSVPAPPQLGLAKTWWGLGESHGA